MSKHGKGLTAPALLRRQYAMNPASVVWREWPRDDDVVKVFAQKTTRRRAVSDEPVVVLNKDWAGWPVYPIKKGK